MHQSLKFLALAGSLAMLAACSGGPSDAEVEAAMKGRINDMHEEGIAVTSAKKKSCKSQGDAYVCWVEVEMSLPMGGGAGKQLAELRMVKSGNGWTYDKNQSITMQPAGS